MTPCSAAYVPTLEGGREIRGGVGAGGARRTGEGGRGGRCRKGEGKTQRVNKMLASK